MQAIKAIESKPKPKAAKSKRQRPKALKKRAAHEVKGEPEPAPVPIPDELTREQWEARVAAVGKAVSDKIWEIGKLLYFGEAKWGDMYSRAAELTGYTPGALRNIKSVYARFPDVMPGHDKCVSPRHDNLSFTHHQLVAPLKYEEDAERFLTEAEKRGWLCREFRSRIRAFKRPGGAEVAFSDEPGLFSTAATDAADRAEIEAEIAAEIAAEADAGDDDQDDEPVDGDASETDQDDDTEAEPTNEQTNVVAIRPEAQPEPEPYDPNRAEIKWRRINACGSLYRAVEELNDYKETKVEMAEIAAHLREERTDPDVRRKIKTILEMMNAVDPAQVLHQFYDEMAELKKELEEEFGEGAFAAEEGDAAE